MDSQTIDISALIGLETLQSIQDSFSNAVNLASVITYPDGTPITKPSNFSRLCALVRNTEQGRKNCRYSDAMLGKKQEDPCYQKCLSAKLCDGAANIYIGKKIVAVWLIGQVVTEIIDEQEVLDYATKLGIDREEAIKALKASTRMPLAQFKKVINSLSVFANQLSKSAYQNMQLLEHQKNLKQLVNRKTEDLKRTLDTLSIKNEELQNKNLFIEKQNDHLKKTLEELRNKEAQLLHAEKMASLGTLTAGVAHEINNPLNYISSSYLVLDKLLKQDNIADKKAQIEQLLDSLRIGVERTSDIVSSLNLFSRTNSNKEEECDVHSILDNCLIMLQHQSKYKAEIIKSYSDHPISIKGNQGNLHQVFLNIINNAVQAIPETGTIHITTKQEKGYNVITIEDSGTGISPENLKQVMDPFYTTKAPGEGTGLGLSISHNIIKQHQGKLSITSELGKGTLVTISLPL